MKHKIGNVSSGDFLTKKKIAIETAPVRKIVNTGQILIKKDEILVEGRKVAFDKNSVLNLAGILGIPESFVKKYSAMFGEDGRDKLINHIAAGLGSHNANVMLIASPVLGQVIDVKPAEHKYISNVSFMQLVEDTLNKFPNLQVSDFFVDDRGNIKIDTVNPEREFNFGKNEDFFCGMNFGQSTDQGTFLSQYLWRMICGNGMFGMKDVRMGSGFDDEVLKGLYKKIDKVGDTGFLPQDFPKVIKSAGETKASLAELNMATSSIKATIPKGKNVANVFDSLLQYNHVMHDLRRRNVIPADLNSQQMKNCRVDCSVWDVVNAMTDYASHDYGYNVKPMAAHEIQRDATKLFFKRSYDTRNLVG